jgi:hypothetical protein
MPKKVRISDDNGVTWSTFPGSSGEFTSEAGDIDDTVLGQAFRSSQTGMIGNSLSTNGFYKGFAGYNAKLLASGTPVALTAEAMALVSGKTYQVTNTAKRTFNPLTTVSFFDNGVAIAVANILNVDYVFGRVTFVPGYTVVGAITVTGQYLPLTAIARANGFTLTQTAEAVDDTDFTTAQGNSGHRTFIPGLKTMSLALTGIYSGSNNWRTLLTGRSQILIEINPDGTSKSVGRGFFKAMDVGQSGNVGDQEAASATFALSVPDIDVLAYPFAWLHDPTTTLNASIKKALAAWQGNLIYDYQYLWDGTNGWQGDGIITDVSLSSGLDAMNDFTINVQGSGQWVTVP